LLAKVLSDLFIPRSWVTEEVVGDDIEIVHFHFETSPRIFFDLIDVWFSNRSEKKILPN